MSAYFGKIKRVRYLTYVKTANMENSSSYAYFKYINLFKFITNNKFAEENYSILNFLKKKISSKNLLTLKKEINNNLSNFYSEIFKSYFLKKKNYKMIEFCSVKEILKFFFILLKSFKLHKINIICKTELSLKLVKFNYTFLKNIIFFLKKNSKIKNIL
jgi:hypothetical protein